jgi:hypothetical protein
MFAIPRLVANKIRHRVPMIASLIKISICMLSKNGSQQTHRHCIDVSFVNDCRQFSRLQLRPDYMCVYKQTEHVPMTHEHFVKVIEGFRVKDHTPHSN